MKHVVTVMLVTGAVLAGTVLVGQAADDSKVRAATREVERGAGKVREGEVREGAAEAARGVGKTVLEGARYTGEKLKESGEAAEPQARTAWQKFRDGTVAFAGSVRSFFAKLFSPD